MPKTIRLLHVVRPSEGGIRSHVVGLASRLPSPRFDQVVAGALDRAFQSDLARRLIPWVTVPVPTRPSPRPLLEAAGQLQRLFTTRQPDVIHAHGYVAGLAAAWALRGAEPKPPLVLTAHVFPAPLNGPGRAGLAERLGYRWLFGRIDRGIAVSRAICEAVQAYTQDGDDRWRVIYNGIDAREFRRRSDPNAKRRELGLDPAAVVVGVVARLSPEKGIDVFLRAAARVAADLPNVDFLVVGDGPERERLETLAHELHLTGQVVFAGQRRDVPDVLAALDLFVAPSREESFGLAALEAIAAGVPLVASDVGGLGEMLAGTDLAHLVAPDDPEALAEVIRRELNTVSLGDEADAEGTELTDGGLLSLADMLVKETEFNLDQTGLATSPQPHAREHETTRGALLARFDLDRMAARTAELYEELVGDKVD